MKSLVPFLFFSVILFSCGTAKKAPELVVAEEKPQADVIAESRIVGVVHINRSCELVIDAKIGEMDYSIIPNNLDDKFKIDGMKIKFFFKNSSMPVPEGCSANARGNVEQVNIVR